MNFKHHYMLYAMESEVLCDLLLAIDEQRFVRLAMFSTRRSIPTAQMVLPLKIRISTQTGRRYLLAYNTTARKITRHRLDSIRAVKPLEREADYARYAAYAEKYAENLWGASAGEDHSIDRVEMTLRVTPDEYYIVQRLGREKRCGTIEKCSEHTYKYTAEVYDATEMMLWLRTFIGRIVSLKCSNTSVFERFRADIRAMAELYGGNGDAV